MELQMCAPCLFGLEGPLRNELKHLAMRGVRGENGRVFFSGTEDDMARANIQCRFAERILIEMGRFRAETFDQLFEGVRAIRWEDIVPVDGALPVKGYALDSRLMSVPDCQRIIKKAVSVRLGSVYHIGQLPESGAVYRIQFSIMGDEAVIYLDTTGVGLHKRGYRPAQVTAPLRETLAAALVDLAGYRGKDDFCDPFCGSGTVAIEAALAAKRQAPGLKRHFAAERWNVFNRAIWTRAREDAIAGEFHRDYNIFASDIDPNAVQLARENAARAGVADIIHFSVADARKFSRQTDGGTLVANPPYGERLLSASEAEALMRDFGGAIRGLRNWDFNILTSDRDIERFIGMRAQKTRRLYNGTIQCGYYMFRQRAKR